MESNIPAGEFAQNLAAILCRVHYRGERFVVEHNREGNPDPLPAAPSWA